MNASLATSLFPRTAESLVWKIALVAAGSIALAVSAKVQVPFWPVPMTLQTLMVLLIGASYGMALGGTTVAVYLAQGAAGLPVFASGAGLAYMAGPTGGYLVGFLLAAILVGWLADRGHGRSALSALAIMIAGAAVIYAPGLGWLATFTGMEKAVAVGLIPFIPAEAIKIALAALLLPAGWKLLRR